jgi:hypothetical protein
MIGRTHLVGIAMRQSAFDRIVRPLPDSFSGVLAIALKPCAVISLLA